MLNKKIVRIVTVIMVGAIALLGWLWFVNQESPIDEYVETRDFGALQAIFKQDMYWLTNADPSIASQVFQYEMRHSSPTLKITDHGRLKTLVYREAGKTVAFIAYYTTAPTQARILYLAVHEDYRKKGYGRTLLEHVLQMLEKKGIRTFSMYVRSYNEKAIALYKKVGFVFSHTEDNLSVYEYTVQ